MASPAHCYYCFECLSATFERRAIPKLDRVIELYEQYEQVTDADKPEETAVVQDEDDEDNEDNDDEEDSEEDDDDEMTDAEGPAETSATKDKQRTPQLPSISRLQQAATPSSRSSSSSTPSILSASSSNSHLTGGTSTTSVNSSRPCYASRLSVTESYPLFVTWNTISRSGHKSLRGCIGTFEGLPLASGLETYALTSAFEDTRFSPIPSSLLPMLSCSLTLLADFESCSDPMDWSLGTHGLRISFTHRNRRHGATYLPDVAVEQGWTKEETLESLMRKAGWDGGYTHGVARRLLRGTARPSEGQGKPWEEVSDFKAVRYTGLKASAAYSDWMEWRTWAVKEGLLDSGLARRR